MESRYIGKIIDIDIRLYKFISDLKELSVKLSMLKMAWISQKRLIVHPYPSPTQGLGLQVTLEAIHSQDKSGSSLLQPNMAANY